jgi:hypothetical protein
MDAGLATDEIMMQSFDEPVDASAMNAELATDEIQMQSFDEPADSAPVEAFSEPQPEEQPPADVFEAAPAEEMPLDAASRRLSAERKVCTCVVCCQRGSVTTPLTLPCLPLPPLLRASSSPS